MTSTPSRVLSAIDPRSYLDLAVELVNRPDSHVARTAGDRAYYAVFLTCRDMLAAKGYAPFYQGTAAHGDVTKALRTFLGDGLGNQENRLRRARNRLTYITDEVPLARVQYIQWMINSAREIIDTVNDLPVRL